MRTLGFIVAALGVGIAVFSTLVFGLIIFVLGLIVLSLNKKEVNVNKEFKKLDVKKSNFQIRLEGLQFRYLFWLRNKFGKWSKTINFFILLFVWRLPLFVLAVYGYLIATEDVEIQSWKEVNCGLAVVFSYVTDPLFNYDLTDRFC